MPPFKFRIRFSLPTDIRINSPEERLNFALPHGVGNVELIGRSPERQIASASELIIRSMGLPSLEEAQRAGARVQAALLLVGADMGIGLDLGREGPRSIVTQYGRQWIAEQTGYEGQLLNDRAGLVVYDDPSGTRFVQFGPVKAIVGKAVDAFIQTIFRHVRDRALDDKHVLALELYNSARFEASTRARFLTLVSVVEVLSSKQPRSPMLAKLITAWQESLIASAVPQEQQVPINSALEDLRNESIGSACREVIRTLVGSDDVPFFRDCYNARSDLLHGGKTDYPIGEHLARLQTIVGAALLRYNVGAA